MTSDAHFTQPQMHVLTTILDMMGGQLLLEQANDCMTQNMICALSCVYFLPWAYESPRPPTQVGKIMVEWMMRCCRVSIVPTFIYVDLGPTGKLTITLLCCHSCFSVSHWAKTKKGCNIVEDFGYVPGSVKT